MSEINERKKLSAQYLRKIQDTLLFKMIPEFMKRYPLMSTEPPSFNDFNKSTLMTIEDLLDPTAEKLDMWGIDAIAFLCGKVPVGIASRYHCGQKFITINMKRKDVNLNEYDKYVEMMKFCKYIIPFSAYFNVQIQVTENSDISCIALTSIPHLTKFLSDFDYLLKQDTNNTDHSEYINICKKTAIEKGLPMVIVEPRMTFEIIN